MAQRCKSTFYGAHSSGSRMVREGTLVDDDDPFVTQFPAMFEPADDYVERMTARPGERRGLARRSREARQQARDTAEKRAVPKPQPEPAAEANQPAQSDSKAAWVDWAVSSGRATRNEAEQMTKAELIELR